MSVLGSIFLVLLGLAVVWFADWPVKLFYDWARKLTDLPHRDYSNPTIAVERRFTGTFERLLAFGLVLMLQDTESIAVILAAWLGAKLAANWERRSLVDLSQEEARDVRGSTLVALMTGIVSVGFGLLAGVIARCGL